jgi:YbbR domain-containing protein
MVRPPFVTDWGFKLLAVAIAVAIWAIIATRDRGIVSASVPIEYAGVARELIVTEAPAETVDVDVVVARWAMARFRPEMLRLRVDLGHATEGEQLVTVSTGDVSAPAGVRVRRVDPQRLRVRLVRAAEATLRVVAVVRGAPAPGHRVAAVRVDPIAVQVKGPRSTIEARDSVQTTPVDVAGRRSSVTQRVGLTFPEAVTALTEGPVRVTVDIQAERGTALETERLGK